MAGEAEKSVPPAPTTRDFGAGFTAGQASALPRPVGGGVYAVVPDGTRLVNLRDVTDPEPKVAKATFAAQSPGAFIDYMKRHRTGDSAVFASVADAEVVGVVDYHGPAGGGDTVNRPGRLVHRAVYNAPLSDQWKAWSAINGAWQTQVDLARFLEENRIDVVTPDGATLLEIVKTLEATKGVAFKSGIRLDNHAVDLKYQEVVEGKAGPDGALAIPTEIVLGIPVFYGADPYKLTAFFRYKIDNGRLGLKIDLHRKQEIYDQAFRDIVGAIKTDLGEGTPVYEGALAEDDTE